ncbi:MAG: GlsB/YeaQ/YmgE family stress response membrane protein [Bacteriovorax sp.]|nr:GlsB/YeaQ/YmgE family stress response membrane protein [Bacteriovorax sp.]
MNTISIMFWILMIGFVTGAIGKYFSPELKQGDLFIAMLIGLLGSVLFGYIGSFTKLYIFGEVKGLIASFIGAVLFVTIYHYKLAKMGVKENGLPKDE